MTISVLAALIILIALPLSYALVKLISLGYETRNSDEKNFARYLRNKERYQEYFDWLADGINDWLINERLRRSFQWLKISKHMLLDWRF